MRTAVRRPAAVLLAVLVLAGCGTRTGSTSGATPAPREATTACGGPAKAEQPAGDMPPNYADNHAFQARHPLCRDARQAVSAEAARAAKALRGLAPVTAAGVRHTLEGLGFDPGTVTTTAAGGAVSFTAQVDLPHTVPDGCLEGSVVVGHVAVRGLGMYAEGGCRKPQPGH